MKKTRPRSTADHRAAFRGARSCHWQRCEWTCRVRCDVEEASHGTGAAHHAHVESPNDEVTEVEGEWRSPGAGQSRDSGLVVK